MCRFESSHPSQPVRSQCARPEGSRAAHARTVFAGLTEGLIAQENEIVTLLKRSIAFNLAE
jgi:hypothetical protein